MYDIRVALQTVNHKQACHKKQPSTLNSVVTKFDFILFDICPGIHSRVRNLVCYVNGRVGADDCQ